MKGSMPVESVTRKWQSKYNDTWKQVGDLDEDWTRELLESMKDIEVGMEPKLESMCAVPLQWI